MSYSLLFELPGLPLTLNARGHWRKKHADNLKWLNLVHLATLGKRPTFPLERAALCLTRCSAKEPDFDNLVSGFKPVVDALVRCGILQNDKMSNIGMPTFHWEKVAPKAGKIRVVVFSAYYDAAETHDDAQSSALLTKVDHSPERDLETKGNEV